MLRNNLKTFKHVFMWSSLWVMTHISHTLLLLLKIVSLPIENMTCKGLWSTCVRLQKHNHIDVVEYERGRETNLTNTQTQHYEFRMNGRWDTLHVLHDLLIHPSEVSLFQNPNVSKWGEMWRLLVQIFLYSRNNML